MRVRVCVVYNYSYFSALLSCNCINWYPLLKFPLSPVLFAPPSRQHNIIQSKRIKYCHVNHNLQNCGDTIIVGECSPTKLHI